MPKKFQSSLGKALQNQQKKLLQNRIANVKEVGKFVHESKPAEEDYQIQQRNLQSIIDQDTLNDYLNLADLANQKFTAERRAEIIPDQPPVPKKEIITKQVIINVNALRLSNLKDNNIFDPQRNRDMRNLRIPRRPEWTKQQSIAELRSQEGEAFLFWRRDLAKFEEEHYTIQLTPYEKNIEVWKQLWRVVEKSDILVQVVDGRDPLFYRCEDLEKYVLEPAARPYRKDQTKSNFLLVNKSDLMSEDIRKAWNEYFLANKIDHMFFSAKLEQERIDKEDTLQEQTITQEIIFNQNDVSSDGLKYVNTHNVATRSDLVGELKKLVQRVRIERGYVASKEEHKTDELGGGGAHDQVVLGMVGYPNVGKSSVINTLCNTKLVGVGSRPGKTKHFQTIQLEKDIMLCDCPGLIFPNASSTRGEMVCNGVLPIDNMKDYLSPIDLLVDRIPKIVFERFYGVNLRDCVKLEASRFLQAYGKKHGHVTGRGLPDEFKAARIVLKDFVNGRLIYAKLPPGREGEYWQSNVIEAVEELIVEQHKEEVLLEAERAKETDFNTQALKSRVKLTNDDLMEIFSQDDLLELMEGKKVKGVKLSKGMRREIKFSFSRGEPIDLRKYLVPDQDVNLTQEGYNKNIKGSKIEIKH